MQPLRTSRMVISLHKTFFNGAFDTMVLLQDQAAELNDGWIRKIGLSPHINTALAQWHALLKKERADLRRIVDRQFNNIEDFWATAETSRRSGIRGPSVANPGGGQPPE